MSYYSPIDYSWDSTSFTLVSRSLYDCQISSFYDIKDSPDYFLGKTRAPLSYLVYPFCNDMVLTIGMTDITFSNDTTKNLVVKTNPYGFFFERARYEMNGVPSKVGDYGLRIA
jgi:hypothetical protein